MLDIHLILSTLALIILSLAGIQALLVAWQDFCLRKQKNIAILKYFPALEKMEIYLFRFIAFGFGLLSLVLVTSIIFFHPIFAPALRSKSLLAIATWIIFAILMLGRHYFGWRGRVAIAWTLIGTALLILIYCGTGFLINGTY